MLECKLTFAINKNTFSQTYTYLAFNLLIANNITHFRIQNAKIKY